MKHTNEYGLPEWVVAALSTSRYGRGDKPSDISVTRLIDSPMIQSLTAIHGDEISKDVMSEVYSTLGSGVHYWFELMAETMPDVKTEERLYAEWDGKVISGQYDVYHDNLVWDVKVTSVMTINRGEPKWVKQLNMLAWLARRNGMEVDGVRILAILRDWSAFKATTDRSYPQAMLQVVELPMWSDEKCESYLNHRFAFHFSGELSCSAEERWQTPDSFAVMKDGGKRALKVCDEYSKAETFIDGHKDAAKLVVQVRRGSGRRCEKYCDVSKWCTIKDLTISYV